MSLRWLWGLVTTNKVLTVYRIAQYKCKSAQLSPLRQPAMFAQCCKCLRLSLFEWFIFAPAVIHKQCIQDWILWELSGNFAMSLNLWFMFSQKGNVFLTNNDITVTGAETVCTFSTGQLPNLRAQLSNHKHLSKKESKVKELWLEMLDREAILNSGTLEYCRQMSPQLPKGIGQIHPSINFSLRFGRD